MSDTLQTPEAPSTEQFLEGFEKKLATLDADFAKRVGEFEARVQVAENAIGGLASQVSAMDAMIKAMGKSGAGSAEAAPPAPGGGDPAKVEAGTPMSWGA